MQKFVMPTLEAEIIDITKDMRFKTKIRQGTGTKADGKLGSLIALQILDKYELEDLATHFVDGFIALQKEKLEYRKDHPYPFGNPDGQPEGDDVA